MSLVEQIASEENLRNSWIQALYHATHIDPYYDSREYEIYNEFLEENLLVLRYELLNQIYEPEPYKIITIQKPNNEIRFFYVASAKENLVLTAILNILGNKAQSLMYSGSYGYRLLPNADRGKYPFVSWQESFKNYNNRARAMLNHPNSSFYLIADIREFYPRISKDILINQIKGFTDPEFAELLSRLLYAKASNSDGQLVEIEGIPTGTTLAPLLANIYLSNFDKFVVENAVDYVRYVDDMVLVCKDETDAVTLFANMKQNLKNLNLEFNIGKSFDKPISVQDAMRLFEHTQKMTYDPRFQVIEDISVASPDEANEIFQEIFLSSQDEADLREIAGKSAAVVVKFFERNSLDNLQNVCLKLLELGIGRLNALKIVLATQMKISEQRDDFNQRFAVYLKQASELDKLVFLKLLTQFEVLSNNQKVIDLLYGWLRTENYLIKALILELFFRLGIDYAPDFFSENNQYIKAKTLLLLSGSNAVKMIQSLLLSEESLTFSLSTSIFIVLRSIIKENNFDEIREIIALFGDSVNQKEIITWLQKQLIKDHRLEWFDLVKNLPSELLEQLILIALSQTEAKSLEALINSYIQLGHGTTFVDIFIKAASKLLDKKITFDNTEAQVLDAKVSDYFRFDCSQEFYGHLTHDPDYICKMQKCPDGSRITIEYIREDRILSSNSFSSLKAWFEYLLSLRNEGIVPLIDYGYDKEEKMVFCVYEIPSGFQTLADVLETTNPYNDSRDPLGILVSVAKSIKITKDEGFQYNGIVPQNIIITSPNQACKLINIGFGLKTPNHNCSYIDCRCYQDRPELGKTTGLYFLGLSVLEILVKSCPMKHVNKYKYNSTEWNKFLNKLDIEPHLRSILGKLLNENTQWRYEEVNVLLDDLEKIKAYREKLGILANHASIIERNKYTLVDYLSFRYSIVLRSPDFSTLTTLEKVKKIVSSISYHVHYIDEKYQAIFKNAIRNVKISNKKLSLDVFIIRQLAPETRYLLRVAQAISHLMHDVRQYFELDIFPMDRIIVCYSLYVELSTYVQYLCFRNLRTDNLVNLAWSSESKFEGKKVLLRIGNLSKPFPTHYTTSNIQEAHQICLFMRESSLSFLNCVRSINSLTLLILLSEFSTSSQDIQSNNLILTLANKSSSDKNFDSAIFSFAENFELELADIIDKDGKDKQMQPVDWEDLMQFLGFLKSKLKIKRISAFVLSHSFWQQRGKIEIKDWISIFRPKLMLHNKLEFQEPGVLVHGNITKQHDKQRYVKCDVILVNQKWYVVSILSKPTLFVDVSPVSDKIVDNLIYFLRRHSRNIRSLFLISVVICVFLNTILAINLLLFLGIWEAVYQLFNELILPENSLDS